MRTAALASISVCALAACNPSAPAGGAFPSLNSSAYRAEATILGDDGASVPVVMIRDGGKMRMEVATPEGPMVMIANTDSGENLMITSVGGQQVAMRMSQEGSPVNDPTEEWHSDMTANATRTGSCSVAGETGVEWSRAPDTDGGTTDTACITDDGIILRAKEGERTVWETTSVQRGPQSAELFTVPPGVQVMDLGNMAAAIE